MSELRDRRTVAVISSDDVRLSVPRLIAEEAGFDVVTALTSELDRDPEDIQQYLERHDPKVVVYDVSPPYAENWELLRRVRESELRHGSRRQFVVTTPDKGALDELVGTTSAIELTGDPGGRELLADAIRRGMLG